MKPQKLQIDILKIDAGTQPRAEIDLDLVADYAERMLEGDEFPPVDVVCDGATFWLAHGFHRYHAACRNHTTTIMAHVTNGTLPDAIWISLGANRLNGKRLSRADKEKAIRMALEKFPEKSSRAIAQHVGVSDHTVEKFRREMESTAQLRRSDMRTGIDGTARPATRNNGKDPEQRVSPKVDGEDAAAESLPQNSPVQSEDDETSAAEPGHDCVGNPITGDVANAFARRGEITQLMREVSDVKKRVLKAIDAGDPLYLDINVSQFQADCNNVYRELRFRARPYALCPYCKGGGCRACLNRGWIGQDKYNSAPEDTRK